ncbi:hypothetical protein [Chromobacterium violaceum]|nr:hypothetical protein [Chromobacterium violaceum]
MFTPLETHYDQGFGAVAISFVHAADVVAEPESSISSINSHLPASFLYRHAIELFLKSGIIILHRKLNIPWGSGVSDEPQVPVAGKWKPLYSVHNLTPLYEHLAGLMQEHAEYLTSTTNTKWVFPTEFTAWINEIDATDSSSTFFRYPVTKHADRDGQKSSIKAEDYHQIIARMGPDAPPQKAFFVLDENDNVVHSYRLDRMQVNEKLDVLHNTANCLYGCHAAMRAELTDDW